MITAREYIATNNVNLAPITDELFHSFIEKDILEKVGSNYLSVNTDEECFENWSRIAPYIDINKTYVFDPSPYNEYADFLFECDNDADVEMALRCMEGDKTMLDWSIILSGEEMMCYIENAKMKLYA